MRQQEADVEAMRQATTEDLARQALHVAKTAAREREEACAKAGIAIAQADAVAARLQEAIAAREEESMRQLLNSRRLLDRLVNAVEELLKSNNFGITTTAPLLA